jgi:hypothetical protein
MNYIAIIEEARLAFNSAILEKKDLIHWYPCGFAWLWMETRSPFAKWATKNNMARVDYPKGRVIGASLFYLPETRSKLGPQIQSMDLIAYGLEAANKVFKSYGIDCTVKTRID